LTDTPNQLLNLLFIFLKNYYYYLTKINSRVNWECHINLVGWMLFLIIMSRIYQHFNPSISALSEINFKIQTLYKSVKRETCMSQKIIKMKGNYLFPSSTTSHCQHAPHELTHRPKESIQLLTSHILPPSVSLIREKT